jgi:hypothetical protein
MTAPFEPLELQLIRSSLATRTDAELAEILERPVDAIRAKIDEITGGESASRDFEISKRREEADQRIEEKKRKKVRDGYLKEKKQKEITYERKRKGKDVVQYENRIRREQSPQNKKYATREIDMSKMKYVRVNKTTHILVPVGTSDQDAIDQYHTNITSKRDIAFNQ